MSGPAGQRPEDHLAPLDRALGLTRAGLLAERVVRAFWPVWSLAFVGFAALAFGLPAALPPAASWTLAVAWGVALVAAFGFGLWRFRWPGRDEALARLDAAMPGRPLAALADKLAVGQGDAASQAVWQAHLRRMAARAALARPVAPNLRMSRRDPYALRYVALLAFALALLFGSVERAVDGGGFAPVSMTAEARIAGPSWEAWVQPPAYTGRPSLYLNEVDRPALRVPQGSRVSVRIYGDSGVLTLAQTVADADPAVAPDAPSHEFEIVRSGRVTVQGPGGRGWEFTVEPDAAPRVRLRGDMERQARGAFRQDFEASDDYGVIAGEAVIELDLAAVERRHGLIPDPEPREALRLDLPMPISGDRAAFTEALIDNLSEHPWANLPVTLRLTVRDARGQTGDSETRSTVLPGRRFFDPMAAAIVEMRRDLLWTRDSGPRVAEVLRAISHRPDDIFRSERAYLLLQNARRELEAGLAAGLDAETRDAVAQALWEIAELIEDGDLADALERLRRAQDRLSEAMRNGADPSEIEELMQELREAMRDYMRQLAERGDQTNDQFAEGERMEITGDQLQELLDRIQELMEQGRMAEAMELLEQLAQMLENMQVTQGEGGQGGEGSRAMQGLGEALRDQQDLSDDTFRDLQDDGGDGRRQAGTDPLRPDGMPSEGEGGGAGDQPEGDEPGEGRAEGEGEGEGAGQQGGSLAERQQALRDRLRQLQRDGLPGGGTEAGEAAREALDDAARAMERAEEALRDGDRSGALDRQAEAIESMRDGIRSLGDVMAGEAGEAGEDRAAAAEGGEGGQRDPLGREIGDLGRIGSQDNMLQDGDVYRRARDILDEIRRRSGEQDRPELELDYLRRLLDRF